MVDVKDPVTGEVHTIGDASTTSDAKAEVKAAVVDAASSVEAGVSDVAPVVEEEAAKVEEAVSTDKTHFIHGMKVIMNDEEKVALDALHSKLEEAQSGRLLSDIHLSDIYYKVKVEVDAFVARLRH